MLDQTVGVDQLGPTTPISGRIQPTISHPRRIKHLCVVVEEQQDLAVGGRRIVHLLVVNGSVHHSTFGRGPRTNRGTTPRCVGALAVVDDDDVERRVLGEGERQTQATSRQL